MCGLGNEELASLVTYVCMFGCRWYKAEFTNSDWLGNYCFKNLLHFPTEVCHEFLDLYLDPSWSLIKCSRIVRCKVRLCWWNGKFQGEG